MAKPNPKVIILSLLGLFFIYLTFKVDWSFIIAAALSSYFSWRILFGKEK